MQGNGAFKESERRIVTVMFVDIAGFTSMAESLDPESITVLMNDCFAIMEETIEKNGGAIDKFMGDCVMAVFGLPAVQELSAINAVNAVIEIRNRIEKFSADNHLEPPLSIHAGINTGIVVAGAVGGIKRRDFTVMGDTVNVAARLEDASASGQILVGPATFQSAGLRFRFKQLSPIPLKGKGEPLPVYELLSDKTRIHRSLPGTNRAIVSPLVGREGEMTLLASLLANAVSGKGRIIHIMGESGIGKSRLVAEIRKLEPINQFVCLEGRALSVGKNLSYHPFIDLFKQWAGIPEDVPESTAIRQLESAFRAAGLGDETEEVLPFVATLMGLNLPEAYRLHLEGIQEPALERLICKSVRQLIARISEKRPLLILMEDLHWADETSIDLLLSLFSVVEFLPVVFLNLFRPRYRLTGERVAAFSRDHLASHLTEILLPPLTTVQSGRLIRNLSIRKEIPQALCDQILARADGNPYFVEEVLRSLLDIGAFSIQNKLPVATEAGSDFSIPQTLNDVIMERIDRLDDRARQLIRIASVIGRSFYQRILNTVAGNPEDLEVYLARLQHAEFIKERKQLNETEYYFKHALTQETAYESILLSTKKRLHRKIAQAIETLYTDRLYEFYGMLSYHYSCAETPEKAEQYMLLAGREAMKSAASSEALHYYREALRIYLYRHGSIADPLRVAELEKNIAVSCYNKGRHEEAHDYFQRALSRYEPEPIVPRFIRKYRLLSDLAWLILSLYCPWFFWKKSPSPREAEIIDLTYRKAAALSNLDPRSFFSESLHFSKLLSQYDVTTISRGVDMLIGLSVIFSWPASSFRLSRKILAFVGRLVHPEDDVEKLTFALAALFPDYYEGRWQQKYDHSLVEAVLKKGEILPVVAYITFHGRIRLEQGDYAGARRLVAKLSEIDRVFTHSLARTLKYYLNIKLLLKYRKLPAALLEADEGIAFASETDFQQIRMVLSAFKTRILILLDDFPGAEIAMQQTEEYKTGLHLPPPYVSNYLITRLLFDLAKLKTAVLQDDSASVRTISRRAFRVGREVRKMAKKLAYERTEAFRLLGDFFHLTQQDHRARNWWQRSLEEGRRLNARVELSRTYLEVGMYLSRPENSHRLQDHSAGPKFMEEARRLFRELNLQWDLQRMKGDLHLPLW
ncbi:MAG: adenylate/guanylate cyclase domain-containing protein [Thermodesulfobacteriota bacterium]